VSLRHTVETTGCASGCVSMAARVFVGVTDELQPAVAPLADDLGSSSVSRAGSSLPTSARPHVIDDGDRSDFTVSRAGHE